ncbi:MAG: hypothetical protein IGS54_14745 [Elainella sp. C42_A2020_010]|nr:hypothetical protein [Elainella sp. C42_A2020_010]
MMKKRWLKFQRIILIFVLAASAVCLPVIIEKTPRIVNKLSRMTKVVEKVFNWDLNPGSIVITEATRVQPLPHLHSGPVAGTLRVHDSNPRYFSNESGKLIYLTGSHTWQNLQDSGGSNPPFSFDYTAYLDFLQVNNHNFLRLWAWEQPRWSIDSPNDNFWLSPVPYRRVGPELATDGLPKFDLNQYEQAYFDRLRERIVEAGKRGIYVSVMLFNGWSITGDKGITGGKNPWRSHPFNISNNVNGINGDLNGDDNGEEVHELSIPAITTIQEAYVRKVIDTVGDLDNVLYEISNESHTDSTQWQYHMIQFIKSYEATKPKQHPVGMTVGYPNGNNADLFASPADWISLNGDVNNPTAADGRKVILADTDHLCGVCSDRRWVWKSFTQGENPLFMDIYDGAFDLIIEQVPTDPLNYTPWVSLRRNLGYALTYANRMNLAAMTPHPELVSTGYCLANPDARNAEYLVYTPSGSKVTVDLSNTLGEIRGEWLNPDNGLVTEGISTTGGGRRSFVVPFENDAILYLKSS